MILLLRKRSDIFFAEAETHFIHYLFHFLLLVDGVDEQRVAVVGHDVTVEAGGHHNLVAVYGEDAVLQSWVRALQFCVMLPSRVRGLISCSERHVPKSLQPRSTVCT